jgi:poly-gamma-glutamate capsule biosynthesis protein CapA/YwtB (metallophosphatase superfamily)
VVSWRLLVLFACAACSARDEATPPSTPRAVEPRALVPDATPTDAALPPPPDAPTRAARVELTFMGDIMFGGYFEDVYGPLRSEVHDPLLEVEPLIASDFALANLETTITRKLDLPGKGHKRFVTIPERVAPLARHGITAVTLSNNHLYDNFARGLSDTPLLAKELGLLVFGATRPESPGVRVESIDIKGWRVAILALTTRMNTRPRKTEPIPPFIEASKVSAELAPLIASARPDHDLVIVAIHWGNEYQDAPARWQITTAHALVDAGADAIIGNHVHVLQGIERYKGGVIAYSLGNFIFQNGKEIIRQAGILRLGFSTHASKPCLDLAAFHPTVQRRTPDYHPAPPTGPELRIAEQRLVTLSKARPLATTWRLDGTRFVTDPSCP